MMLLLMTTAATTVAVLEKNSTISVKLYIGTATANKLLLLLQLINTQAAANLKLN